MAPRPYGWDIDNLNILVRNLINRIRIAAEKVMLDLVSLPPAWRLSHNEERVEEIGIVLFVIDDPGIGRLVTRTQGCESIHVVSVPVAQVLDLRTFLFNRPENLFLIVAILEKAHSRSLGAWTGTNDAEKTNVVLVAH